MRAERLSPVSGSPVTPSNAVFASDPVVACFSVTAQADPSVMPRVLELFAKRGLIPSRWHSDLGGRRRDELMIDLQVEGLDRDKADLIGHAMRQMVPVLSVLISQKSYA
jgi:acetolactate synthase small subunit